MNKLSTEEIEYIEKLINEKKTYLSNKEMIERSTLSIVDFCQYDAIDIWDKLDLPTQSYLKREYLTCYQLGEEYILQAQWYEETFGEGITKPIFLFNACLNSNNSDIVNKLINIGYTKDDNITFDNIIATDNGKIVNYVPNECYYQGDNKNIFLDIARIQAGTDMNQWFIDDISGKWRLSDKIMSSTYVMSIGSWRKATPTDIINKYNNEN